MEFNPNFTYIVLCYLMARNKCKSKSLFKRKKAEFLLK
jgi:hypothetical protein